ncbi:hypothetical protein BpHYR1_017899 [Brachionus plicatilis]|uniref:Uncharacterized protein n=1 Tax=Brachionus plicatilis TaxID=10195 RepID=A0A3M7SWT3_BRAPC|nr:hypothetical protein BpHYR1_017899 [Brachionus plicatilis]
MDLPCWSMTLRQTALLDALANLCMAASRLCGKEDGTTSGSPHAGTLMPPSGFGTAGSNGGTEIICANSLHMDLGLKSWRTNESRMNQGLV